MFSFIFGEKGANSKIFMYLLEDKISMKCFRCVLISFIIVFSAVPSTVSNSSYRLHDPIIIENVPSSLDNPYIVEGYEISNPDGPGIQIRNVEYVVIRNNYVHDCGTAISEKIQERIRRGEGDANLAMMRDPFETGAILVFGAKHVEIYDNTISNNDYGFRVCSHDRRMDHVSIRNNTVRESHRSYFISVFNADNVEIRDNHVQDNGLSIFFDNKALLVALKQGEDYGDGRSQGIRTDGCNHVRIIGNTVINSNSDGIGVTHGELEYVEDIEIAHNTVLRNGEQGLWLVKARNGEIHDNLISENRHRRDTTGGSNGIMFEERVHNFEIRDNEISYNDRFGIYLASSSNTVMCNNEIHHNGEGAICWDEHFYLEHGESTNTTIRDNTIHHNRVSVFHVFTSRVGTVTIKSNTITHNGGDPIHYEDYEDHDTTAHPEDWEYEGESVLVLVEDERFIDLFEVGTNTIDGVEVTGLPEEKEESEETAPPKEVVTESPEPEETAPPEKDEKETQKTPSPSREPDKSGNKAYFALIGIVIALFLLYLKIGRGKRKKPFFVIFLASLILVLVIIRATTNKEEYDIMEKDTKERYAVNQEENDRLLDEYCSTSVSQHTIERNKASHFDIIHSDPAYHQDLVDAGLVWERTISMMLDMNALETMSDNEFEKLLKQFDMYIMKAQLNGIWFVQEVFVNQLVENCNPVKERLRKFAERYDMDGIDDMTCLKYPVEYFAIGNEVEVKDFFSGSEENYFSILKMSYETIREANLDGKIVQSGMVSAVDNPYWDTLFDMGATAYFDIANIHEVSGRGSVLKICTFKEEMSKRELTDIPWWVTETQFENTNETPSLSSEEYAKIMTKYITYALAQGYDKLFIVNFKSPIPGVPDANPPFGDASALINSNDEKTDLFYAVKTTIHMLDHFETVEVLNEQIFRGHEEDGTWNIRVTEGQYKFTVNGQPVYVLWGGKDLPKALEGTVLVTDIYGHTQKVSVDAVTVADTPIFIEPLE